MTIPAHVQNRDVHAAQTALDDWIQQMQGRDLPDFLSDQGALVLRGVLATFAADVRQAGYLEGVQTGRRQMAHVLWDALDGEGLSPSPSDPRDLDR